jgi:hypothetical protein
MRDSARISELWVNEGLEAVVRELVGLDPAWLGVYLELIRRIRTDPDFKRRIEEREQELVHVNRARLEEAQQLGEFRDDFEVKELGSFVNLVLNGLVLQRAQGDEGPSVELVVRLLEDAIGGRAPSRRRRRTPA